MPDKPAKALINSHLFRKTGASMKDAFAPIPEDEANRIREVAKGLMGEVVEKKDNTGTVPVQCRESNGTEAVMFRESDGKITGTVPGHDRPSTGTVPVLYRDVTGTLPLPGHDRDVTGTPHIDIELTDTQMTIYKYLISEGIQGTFNQSEMAQQTGMQYETVRKIIKRLKFLEVLFIDSYNNATKQLKYRISNTKNAVPGRYRYRDVTGTGQSAGTLISSSSSLYNKTTTPAHESFLDHPEMYFWEKQGVTSDMIKKNIEHHKIDSELFIQSMKYYAFEFSQPGSRQPEKTHLAHLIGGIRQFGAWVKPNTYISHEERQEIDLRALIEEKKKRSESLESLKRELAFEDWYLKYQENPESEEVKVITKQANSFENTRINKLDAKKKALFELWVRVNK